MREICRGEKQVKERREGGREGNKLQFDVHGKRFMELGTEDMSEGVCTYIRVSWRGRMT